MSALTNVLSNRKPVSMNHGGKFLNDCGIRATLFFFFYSSRPIYIPNHPYCVIPFNIDFQCYFPLSFNLSMLVSIVYQYAGFYNT